MEFVNICLEFGLDQQKIVSVQPFGSGYIHDTYRVETHENIDYILQKINGDIFTHVPIMQSLLVNRK